MLLQVTNLQIEFFTDDGVLRAVDGISFGVDSGKTLGIVGESGCGKSVTALSLMRLLAEPPSRIRQGQILFGERDLRKVSAEEMRHIRGREIGMIFQEPMTSLNPVYTVGFQISEAIQTHFPELSKEELQRRTIQVLETVGYPEPNRRYYDYPHQLSGGMRQRIMIAMAISCQPKLLIADEPTTALDVTIQAQILELLKKLQKEFGMSIILITHDLGIVAETADDVMVMYAGKVVENAPVKELFRSPRHPYTKGLLASLPSLQKAGSPVAGAEKTARLRGIRGMVPDLRNLPPGCRFQDRCDWVQPHCRETEPPLEPKVPGHLAACFESEKVGAT